MRDDTIEFNILPKGSQHNTWFRIDMQSRTVSEELVGIHMDSGVDNAQEG
jgi:hypothetical protein